jgi:hypothetical protein
MLFARGKPLGRLPADSGSRDRAQRPWIDIKKRQSALNFTDMQRMFRHEGRPMAAAAWPARRRRVACEATARGLRGDGAPPREAPAASNISQSPRFGGAQLRRISRWRRPAPRGLVISRRDVADVDS